MSPHDREVFRHVKTNSGPIASSWTGRHSRPMSRQPTPLRCQEADGQRTGHHAKSVQTKESSAVGLSEGKNDWSPVHVKHRHRGRNRAVPVSLLGRPRRQRADVQTPNGAALLDLARQYLRLLLQILPESFWQKGKKKKQAAAAVAAAAAAASATSLRPTTHLVVLATTHSSPAGPRCSGRGGSVGLRRAVVWRGPQGRDRGPAFHPGRRRRRRGGGVGGGVGGLGHPDEPDERLEPLQRRQRVPLPRRQTISSIQAALEGSTDSASASCHAVAHRGENAYAEHVATQQRKKKTDRKCATRTPTQEEEERSQWRRLRRRAAGNDPVASAGNIR